MAGISNIVLRWVMDDAKATLASKKAVSEVFNEGGFKWSFVLDGNTDSFANLTICCDVDHNSPYDVEVKMYMTRNNGGDYDYFSKERHCFDENNNIWKREHSARWTFLTDQVFLVNGKSTIEFRIKIISSERGQPMVHTNKFAAPNIMSNVILKIGENKLHVSKEMLAIQSPVFNTLFFGDFAEKGKAEVEIKEVVYEEFIDILHLIYLGTVNITDRTVQHIMKIADQYQMERVMDLSEKHLTQPRGFDVVKKLIFADRYRLTTLRDQCLKSFTNNADLIEKISSSPEYVNFSSDMRTAICDRIMKK